MPLPSWHTARHRALHITIRDIDCATFDVEQTIDTLKKCRVTLFSFFAGGYVTTYPSKLSWQRVSRHLAPGRDLCGEIIVAAHRAGIVAFPMIDLGELPLEIAQAHPEWAAQNATGSPYLKTDGIAISCPVGQYRRELARELVHELKSRYGADLDGIKWGGASYGFPPGIDHNPLAIEAWKKFSGHDSLPETNKDPVYANWAHHVTAENVALLRRTVHEVANVPVVGNSIWSLGDGLALEELTPDQDFTQVEVQTRTFNNNPDNDDIGWERFTSAAETARYVSACCKNPPWVIASYFLAWPWRRVAVPHHEQKLFLAQLAAHGASPMVNLTTGAPHQHEDPRGFAAIDELFNFMARHDAWYQNDRSAARVAIVYDHPSASAARAAGRLYKDYVDELHACEETLDCSHIPYDLVSTRMIERDEICASHKVLIIPAPAAINAAARARLCDLRAKGIAQIFTGPLPTNLDAAQAAETFGYTNASAAEPFHVGAQRGQLQAYLRPADSTHPLLKKLPAPQIACAGYWQKLTLAEPARTPLIRAEPFRLFPEGIAYTETPDPAEPMAICLEGSSAARRVIFPFTLGRTIRRTGHPDPQQLLVNAIAWASRETVQPICERFRDVRMSLRRSAPGLALHLINTTGRGRHLTEFTPLYELPLAIPCAEKPIQITCGTDGASLPFTHTNGVAHVTLPELVDYEMLQLHLR